MPPPNPLALPSATSPDSVDTLTELAAILARVRYTDKNNLDHNASTGLTPAPAAPDNNGADAPISVKDFPTATDTIKHKVQRARAQIKELPDIERTTGEQEAEMRELEARIAMQREVLEKLKDVGTRFGAEDAGSGGNGDVVMTGSSG